MLETVFLFQYESIPGAIKNYSETPDTLPDNKN